MRDAAAIIATIAGVLLILLVLRDVTHELLHPSGNGDVAQAVMRVLWRAFRALGGRRQGVLAMAGPLIFVAVLIGWGALLLLGWALIYWPHVPLEYRYATGLAAGAGALGRFADAFYVSALSLSTLGFGDVTPTATWLRLATTVEAFIGFALLTAGISWIGMLYPVLARRRAFSRHVAALGEATARGAGIGQREDGDAAALLDALTAQLTMLRADAMHTPISYYFHDCEQVIALPKALRDAHELAREATRLGSSSRHAGVTLGILVEDLVSFLASTRLAHHVAGASFEDSLRALEREHQSGPQNRAR